MAPVCVQLEAFVGKVYFIVVYQIILDNVTRRRKSGCGKLGGTFSADYGCRRGFALLSLLLRHVS